MTKLYICTSNKGKLQEIKSELSGLPLDIECVTSIDIEETENTLEGNAKLKAKEYAMHTQGLTLAEDSGLIVEALSGLPGVYSARFHQCMINPKNWTIEGFTETHAEQRDKKNIECLLTLMKDFPGDQRRAYFKTVAVLCDANGDVLFEGKGVVKGVICAAPRGANGFGYDPLFIADEATNKTFAELLPNEKNAISHRKRALEKLKSWLEHSYFLK